MTTDRQPSISIHDGIVRSKDRERQELQAKMAAFEAKRGNKVQVLPTQLGLRPDPSYRQLNDAMAANCRARASNRRRHGTDDG